MTIKKPDLKTLQDVIDYSTLYDIRKYTRVNTVEGLQVIEETLFDIYFKLIEPYVQRVSTLTSHQRYSYNPKLLARDLYGTPDLDWVLVKLNCDSMSRFKIEEKINYIHPDDIDTVFELLANKINA